MQVIEEEALCLVTTIRGEQDLKSKAPQYKNKMDMKQWPAPIYQHMEQIYWQNEEFINTFACLIHILELWILSICLKMISLLLTRLIKFYHERWSVLYQSFVKKKALQSNYFYIFRYLLESQERPYKLVKGVKNKRERVIFTIKWKFKLP